MVDLYTLARALLDRVVAEFSLAGVPLPARQYVSNGAVAFDCEQLVVQVGDVRHGLPEGPEERRLKLPRMMSTDLSVWLIRCVPVQDNNGRPPNAAAIEASATEILLDRRLCWLATMSKDWQDECQDASGGTNSGIGPEGGYGGSVTRVTVQL